MSLKQLWCHIAGCDIVKHEKEWPNGDREVKFECSRCGNVAYGAMTATADTV